MDILAVGMAEVCHLQKHAWRNAVTMVVVVGSPFARHGRVDVEGEPAAAMQRQHLVSL